MRVGVFVKGLFFYGDFNVNFVVLCLEKFIRILLERVVDVFFK